jgi:signal transduction histidine kinase
LSEEEQTVVELERSTEELRPVDADREAATQSIFNLLSNAAKYSPEQARIVVRMIEGDAEVGVEVRDSGIGIPAAEQKRIFDDFYRAPQARQVGVEGTGLGLALVKRHMTACGGRAEVRSAPGQGSRFTLWFPVSQEKDGADNRRDRGR